MSRILQLSSLSNDGRAVVYVMSRDQRCHDNHALLAAQEDAMKREVPLIVLFNLYTGKTVRTREHFDFMLSGLREVANDLEVMNIRWVMRTGEASESTLQLLREVQAASVYFDFNPLAGQRRLAKLVATRFSGSTYVVDTHNIIPVWAASDKQEFAAHTMRFKVHKLLAPFIVEPPALIRHPHTLTSELAPVSFEEATEIIKTIPASGIDVTYQAGEKAAHSHLSDFLQYDLSQYATLRNDIANDHQTGLSPYLHFGQISSLRVALETLKVVDRIPLLFEEAKLAKASGEPSSYDGMNALLEEMIVRKELADNFCFYNDNYKSLSGAHAWAQKTLDEHRDDPREFVYTDDEWEYSKTHDLSWNAAQNQLRKTGKIHGYMRMYWAKKVLEWSKTPEDALRTCIYLNDKYSIDGGDPNGYVGILWSLAGVHDRPWAERAVFGKIRYMNAGGLMRKFDIDSYISQWP